MTGPITVAPSITAKPQVQSPEANAPLREVAMQLEASFLAEMLKHAGFGQSRDQFGGGVGEAQFTSLLQAEHARALVERGGIGLAQSIYSALLARGDHAAGDRS